MPEAPNPEHRRWLKPFLKPFKGVFREVVAMSFFVNVLALAIPVFSLQVYDRVVGSGGISTLQGLFVGMILVLIFDFILRQSRARILQTVALRVDVQLGRRLFRKLMRLPLQTLESRTSAHWSALFRDVDIVRNTLSGASALLLADLPFAILFLVLIFVIAAPVAWVLLIMLPVFMLVAWRSSSVMSQASGEERQTSQSRDSLVAEMISGRTTIKALALDRSMEPVWEEKHAQNIENAIHRGTQTDSFSNIGSSLSLVTSLLLTTVGALAIIDQNLTMGALIATNMLSGKIIGPLNQLVGMWRTYSSFLQATDRLGEIFASDADRAVSEVKLKKPKGKLTIENVVFSYSEDLAPVISDISLEINPGGIHAMVGRNGCGKTTLLKIIQGLYTPQKGRVLMDDADMAQFTRSELADWLGYVPQESVLFTGTVRDNIASRMPQASDEDIIKAATEAGVHHFIIDLPDGYATDIGEAGSRLSGGQRQRIAVARALVGSPPVVLLDEPSSSLDRHAEHELKDTLVEIAKTRTVIIVSHSPTLLSACDYLYALDRGRLALAGPSSEVLPRLFGGKAGKKGKGAGTAQKDKGAGAAQKGGATIAAKPTATAKPAAKPTAQPIPNKAPDMGVPIPSGVVAKAGPASISAKATPVAAKPAGATLASLMTTPAQKAAPTPKPVEATPAEAPAPAPVKAKISAPRLQAAVTPRPAGAPPQQATVTRRLQPRSVAKAKLAAVLRAPKSGTKAILKVTTRAAPQKAQTRTFVKPAATPTLRQAKPTVTLSPPRKNTGIRSGQSQSRPALKVGASIRLRNNAE
ncbi:MAG: type I secretion system ATPase [Rhodospirillaceae bacterium]|nr:MAG: type I secretion system ATPase [Rhodospirillaceae bacterium]